MKIIKLKLQSLHKITKAVFQFMYFFYALLKNSHSKSHN